MSNTIHFQFCKKISRQVQVTHSPTFAFINDTAVKLDNHGYRLSTRTRTSSTTRTRTPSPHVTPLSPQKTHIFPGQLTPAHPPPPYSPDQLTPPHEHPCTVTTQHHHYCRNPHCCEEGMAYGFSSYTSLPPSSTPLHGASPLCHLTPLLLCSVALHPNLTTPHHTSSYHTSLHSVNNAHRHQYCTPPHPTAVGRGMRRICHTIPPFLTFPTPLHCASPLCHLTLPAPS